MNFSLEQKQDEGWVNVAYGEFATLNEALDEMKWGARVFDVPLDELRLTPIAEIPEHDVRHCPCGGMVQWTKDQNCWCSVCGKTYSIGSEELE
jgi:hypothetical protein